MEDSRAADNARLCLALVARSRLAQLLVRVLASVKNARSLIPRVRCAWRILVLKKIAFLVLDNPLQKRV